MTPSSFPLRYRMYMYILAVVHIARYRLKRGRKRKEGEIQQCSRKVDGGREKRRMSERVGRRGRKRKRGLPTSFYQDKW